MDRGRGSKKLNEYNAAKKNQDHFFISCHSSNDIFDTELLL
jgi:hypothetical protein